MIQNLDMTSI